MNQSSSETSVQSSIQTSAQTSPVTPQNPTHATLDVPASTVMPTALVRISATATDGIAWLKNKAPAHSAAVTRSALQAAGGLKAKIKDFDVRRRVADLQRSPDATVFVPPRSKPISRLRPRLSESWSWMSWMFATGCLFAAGVAHIVTVFALPLIGATSAFERLRPQLPVNAMTVLAPAAPGGTHIPFLSPDVRYAMCRYDLSGGPVVVSATLPEAGWTLAIHAPDGENFYLVPGQEQRRTEIAFTITRSNERSLIAAPGVRRNDVDATQVTSPRPEGLVVLRAPVRGLAFRDETETILKTATCRPQIR
jgi:uncharacterized membrane protein